MRFSLLLAALAMSPAIAEAGVDFKCESVKVSDQIGGWLRFGFAGRNGVVQVEYWNGYPPITLVEADLDNGTTVERNKVRYTSQPDRLSAKVATIYLPDGFLAQDKFSANFEISPTASEGTKGQPAKYEMSCVRH